MKKYLHMYCPYETAILLPKKINLNNGDEVLIDIETEVLITGGEYSNQRLKMTKEYDHYVAWTIDKITSLPNTTNIVRYGKIAQQQILKSAGIDTPQLVGVKYNGILQLEKFDDTVNSIIVKDDMGAKGNGQLILDYKWLLTVELGMLKEKLNLDVVKFKERFPNISIYPVSNSKIFACDEYIVSKFLHDIQNEYRVMIIGDEYFIYKRVRTKNTIYNKIDMSFSNNELIRIQSLYPDKEQFGLQKDISDIIIKVKEVFNLIYGSVDIYVLKDGSVGVFEVSNEFGMDYLPTDVLLKSHDNFIRTLSEEIFKDN